MCVSLRFSSGGSKVIREINIAEEGEPGDEASIRVLYSVQKSLLVECYALMASGRGKAGYVCVTFARCANINQPIRLRRTVRDTYIYI